MLTLVTGTSIKHPRNAAGFTLLELLVVLAILTLTVGIAVLKLPSGHSQEPLKIAERIEKTLSLFADRALIEAADYGLVLAKDGYKICKVLLEEESGDLIFEEVSLYQYSAPLETELRLEGQPVILEQLDDAITPHIFIFSSMEQTAFELTLANSDNSGQVTMVGTPVGHINLETPNL